jgi:hypothetical protein
MALDFKKATDRVSPCVTQADIAQAAGVSVATIKQARFPEDHVSYRRPPEGWERVLARLAREKAADLTRLAEELERE